MQAMGIDLGSNTLRAVLLGEKDEILWEFECVVRTAEGFAKAPVILPQTIARLCDKIRAMQADLRDKTGLDFASLPTLALATAALRKAQNQADVLAALAELQIPFRVINAAQEAIFTLNAALFALHCHAPKNLGAPFLLLDIGGASTELCLYHGDGQYLDAFGDCALVSKSFDIGIVTLSERDEADKRATLDSFESQLQSWLASLESPLPQTLLASGGVPQVLVNLANGAPKQTPQTLHSDEIARVSAFYPTLSVHEQIARVGAGRENLILPGIALFNVVLRTLGLQQCLVVQESLREGAALHIKYF
ncbi:MAG: hypothetical protein HDT11_05790 [Helicobacter sp.]|nr:hypothetical protein [Helicobacter sp.]